MLIYFIGAFLSTLIFYICFINLKKPRNFPPGPLNLPIIGGLYALGMEPHKKIMKLKKKYGKIIGMNFGSSRAVILADHDVIKEAFDSQIFADRPDFEVSRLYRDRIHTGLIWGREKHYEEQYRYVIKSLCDFGVGRKSTEKIILTHLENLLQIFERKMKEPIMNSKLFNSIVFQILWTILAGESPNTQDEDCVACIESIDRYNSASSAVSSNIFFFPKISKMFPTWSGWSIYMDTGKKQKKFLEKSVAFKKEIFSKSEHQEPNNFIEAYLQKIKNTENQESSFFGKLGEDNLVAVLGDLFITTESIANVLDWSMLLLTLNPHVQQKMQKEIVTALPNRKTLATLDDRNKLPYVEATILEILRYSAILPMAFPHETGKDTYLQGYFLPKGTVVIPHIYGVLHDPELWEQPEVFNPDRFLNEDKTSISTPQNFNIAFGTGKRLCIGKTMAEDELFLILTGLVQRFTFSIDPNSPKPKIEGKLGTILVPHPHSMIIHKR